MDWSKKTHRISRLEHKVTHCRSWGMYAKGWAHAKCARGTSRGHIGARTWVQSQALHGFPGTIRPQQPWDAGLWPSWGVGCQPVVMVRQRPTTHQELHEDGCVSRQQKRCQSKNRAKDASSLPPQALCGSPYTGSCWPTVPEVGHNTPNSILMELTKSESPRAELSAFPNTKVRG